MLPPAPVNPEGRRLRPPLRQARPGAGRPPWEGGGAAVSPQTPALPVKYQGVRHAPGRGRGARAAEELRVQ